MEDKVTPAVTAQVQKNVRQTDVAVLRLNYSVTQGATLAYHVEISKNFVCNM